MQQQQIVEELRVKPTIDPGEEIRFRVNFLKEYLLATGLKGLVLGISGGQDSSLCGKLCQKAIEELREETGRDYLFIALRLPYGVQKDEDDAQLALKFIQPDKQFSVDIKPAVDAAVRSFEAATGEQMSDFNKGNQKAQERMTVHYRFANHFQLLVVGTDHAAEALTGFFTKYGDGGVDVVPLTGLTKLQGRQLLQELGAPERLYEKQPTADLLDTKPLQADETELGVSYETIDHFLTGRQIDPESHDKLVNRFTITRHKRALPVSPFDSWWKNS